MSTNILNLDEIGTWMVALCIFWAIRDLVRKAIALYRAGQNSHKIRFIFIFIFNTCGILPIIYLLLNRKENK